MGLPVSPARPDADIDKWDFANAMNGTRSAYACLAKVAPPAFHARTRSDGVPRQRQPIKRNGQIPLMVPLPTTVGRHWGSNQWTPSFRLGAEQHRTLGASGWYLGPTGASNAYLNRYCLHVPRPTHRAPYAGVHGACSGSHVPSI